ncbi:hypothetical protein AVEN_205336-1 [Araneus ventricosus]|uniref:DUF4817 domain-containing protein n=1 Tax=Araneus ventricosus TaxID=182803 RepID=A0A4Y2LPB8_ARAVE|nr:hypothetical protein AVEN_205336-1 [Araneus ventricosus]
MDTPIAPSTLACAHNQTATTHHTSEEPKCLKFTDVVDWKYPLHRSWQYSPSLASSRLERSFLPMNREKRLERSPTSTRRNFQKRFNVPKGPDAKTIRKLFAKFEQTGNVEDNRVGNVGPRQTVNCIRDRFEAFKYAKNIEKQPMDVSIQNPKSSGHTHKSCGQRFDFANEILTMIDNEGFDAGCIWFIDEAHFHLNGFVNKQNWRFWGSENPHLCEKKPLHSPKVTAWVAECNKGIIGPFSMRGTISSDRYITILDQFVSTQLALEDRPRIEWFIQDGTRRRRTDKVFRFLDEFFGNRVIELDYPKFTGTGMDWPPYSPDLTPCDYFLWSALKDTVYGNHPSTLDELEPVISVACNSISVETLKDVMTNFILRLRHLIFSSGEHFENIVS